MVGVDALSLQSLSTIILEGAICHLLRMLSLMKLCHVANSLYFHKTFLLLHYLHLFSLVPVNM